MEKKIIIYFVLRILICKILLFIQLYQMKTLSLQLQRPTMNILNYFNNLVFNMLYKTRILLIMNIFSPNESQLGYLLS